jgi:protein associated with RNAse G/E
MGSLDNIANSVIGAKINYSLFQEPDLNNALTAICFIADERVWDRKKYPEFIDYILDIKMYPEALAEMPAENEVVLRMQTEERLKELFPEYYKEWIDFIGGEKNLFLKELIKNKKLA